MAGRPRERKLEKRPFHIVCVCDHGWESSPKLAARVAEALSGKRADFSAGKPSAQDFHTAKGHIPFRISTRGVGGIPPGIVDWALSFRHASPEEMASFLGRVLDSRDLEGTDLLLSMTPRLPVHESATFEGVPGHLREQLRRLKDQGRLLEGKEFRGLPKDEVRRRLLEIMERLRPS